MVINSRKNVYNVWELFRRMKMKKPLRNETNVNEAIEVVRKVLEVHLRDHRPPRLLHHRHHLPRRRLLHLLHPKIVQIEINQRNVRGLPLLSFFFSHSNASLFVLCSIRSQSRSQSPPFHRPHSSKIVQSNRSRSRSRSASPPSFNSAYVPPR